MYIIGTITALLHQFVSQKKSKDSEVLDICYGEDNVGLPSDVMKNNRCDQNDPLAFITCRSRQDIREASNSQQHNLNLVQPRLSLLTNRKNVARAKIITAPVILAGLGIVFSPEIIQSGRLFPSHQRTMNLSQHPSHFKDTTFLKRSGGFLFFFYTYSVRTLRSLASNCTREVNEELQLLKSEGQEPLAH
ncbi:hypothetical protein K432DRAFT_59961 [Lepidopterella palustris CBS 459.81]|uniref:Uncharacterized protein n=1 Tax=Lepidopterella palustris CBS 459.81 TaxID=1314670 RepID=A0A8E2JEQ0_9PEZI|nr:hypothetical protein K432DRAFT_59961 [Lepidopterella palustris CBS 459.81]